jgi:hypothetical protein
MALQNFMAGPAAMAGIVQPENLYNYGEELVKNLGIKSPDKFFTSPDKIKPQQPPPPDPMVAIKGQELQVRTQELQVDAQKHQAQLQFDQWKAEQDNQLKLYIAQLDSQTKEVVARMQSTIDEQSQIINAQANQQRAENESMRNQILMLDKMQSATLASATNSTMQQANNNESGNHVATALAGLADGIKALQDLHSKPKDIQFVRDPMTGKAVGARVQ